MIGTALVSLLSLSASVFHVSAAGPSGRRPNFAPAPAIPAVLAPEYEPKTPAGTPLPPFNTTYYFDQLIDHKNPSAGTFKQAYYFTSQFYEPGGPIIIMTPGESGIDGYSGYLTNRTVNGQIAQATKGATIVFEHRFFGNSVPYGDLSEKSYKVFTMDQNVADVVYFAQNVVLPMANGGSVKAGTQADWFLIGGSYSGALTSWVMHSHPGVFWGGYSSSGVVEAIEYYWGYFDPIRQYMPSNCSSDVQSVIAHMDSTFTHGTSTQIKALKAQFGMSNVTHLDDVAGALRNPIWNWQSLSPTSGGAVFYDFCDALEVNSKNVSAPAHGWGLEHALGAFGSYMVDYLNEICAGEVNDDCLGTYDPTLSYYTDVSIGQDYRSWEWLICNFFGYWQDGAPEGWPSIVTRLIGPAYDNRQCGYWFPETFPKGASPKTSAMNKEFGGWNVNTPRLFFANGKRDPWRDATVSSDFHTRQSSSLQPIYVGDGFHCSDLITSAGVVDTTIAHIQAEAVKTFSAWHKSWKAPSRYGGYKREESMELEGRADSSIPESIAGAAPASVPASIANAPTNAAPGKVGAKRPLNNGFGGVVASLQ